MVDATNIATALMGDSIAANMFMLGYSWQKGWVPLEEAALMRAIELNGVAIDFNKQAFNWGRVAANDLERSYSFDDSSASDRVETRTKSRRHHQQTRRFLDRLPKRRLRAKL